jgi:hypothetical protein
MKMTRQDLKGIVKECLVEILSEGLVSTQNQISESRQAQGRSTMQEQRTAPVQRPNTADKISFLPNREDIRRANSRPQQDVSQNLARSLTSDPVLADIFADTARSGAHRQMNESATNSVNHEMMVATAGDAAAKAMLHSDPTDVFAESAGKWASLAFAEKIPARS